MGVLRGYRGFHGLTRGTEGYKELQRVTGG